MIKLICRILACAAVLSAAPAPETFTGTITDSHCGIKHNMQGHSDAECVKLCVKGSAEYVLFDGQNVLKLSNQKAPAKFAAQKVKIGGTLDPKTNTIKVVSIEAAGGN